MLHSHKNWSNLMIKHRENSWVETYWALTNGKTIDFSYIITATIEMVTNSCVLKIPYTLRRNPGNKRIFRQVNVISKKKNSQKIKSKYTYMYIRITSKCIKTSRVVYWTITIEFHPQTIWTYIFHKLYPKSFFYHFTSHQKAKSYFLTST